MRRIRHLEPHSEARQRGWRLLLEPCCEPGTHATWQSLKYTGVSGCPLEVSEGTACCSCCAMLLRTWSAACRSLCFVTKLDVLVIFCLHCCVLGLSGRVGGWRGACVSVCVHVRSCAYKIDCCRWVLFASWQSSTLVASVPVLMHAYICFHVMELFMWLDSEVSVHI